MHHVPRDYPAQAIQLSCVAQFHQQYWMGLKRIGLPAWPAQSHLRLWGPRWRHTSGRRLLRTRENSAASTLLQPRSRFHDSFLPGRLDAVLRQGSPRSNQHSNRVSVPLHLNTRARPYKLCSVPIYEIWFQATGSGAAATTFMASMTVAAFIASIGSVQTSSRLTWSFARDDAMILSSLIKRTNDQLGVPVWALLFNAFWLFIIGCVYLASSSGESPLSQSSCSRQPPDFALILPKRSTSSSAPPCSPNSSPSLSPPLS